MNRNWPVFIILLFTSASPVHTLHSGMPASSTSGIPDKIHSGDRTEPGTENPYPCIGAIPLPPGYRRVNEDKGSFGAWLRGVRLKKDKTVYLYDGRPKANQSAQFAVLDVPVGHEDLQQCADAVMRLRAEYLYSLWDSGAFHGPGDSRILRRAGGSSILPGPGDSRNHRERVPPIRFETGQGLWLNFADWVSGVRYHVNGGLLRPFQTERSCTGRSCLEDYLHVVFSYCGTLSLEKQLVVVKNPLQVRSGDVWIKGGSPGHAMMVIDRAVNSRGQEIYLLAQSYMPAQDIHVVINPENKDLSPWYEVNDRNLTTPEWTFAPGYLRTWTNL